MLEPFLVEAGALDPADPHYANRRVFSVADFADLLSEIATLVSLATLRADLGISRNEIEARVVEGILMPRCRSDIVRLRWSAVQAKTLLSGLMANAVPVSETLPEWESLLRAKKRTGVTLQAQIDAALQGRLILGFAPEQGFSGLRIRKEDVDRLKLKVADPEADDLIPAIAFGVSVGIKDKGRFRKLILAGHTPATSVRHERTGVENLYMTPNDIAVFRRRFVTMLTLAEETGQTIPELRAAFKRAGLEAFSPDGADYGRIFLRDIAETALSGKS